MNLRDVAAKIWLNINMAKQINLNYLIALDAQVDFLECDTRAKN